MHPRLAMLVADPGPHPQDPMDGPSAMSAAAEGSLSFVSHDANMIVVGRSVVDIVHGMSSSRKLSLSTSARHCGRIKKGCEPDGAVPAPGNQCLLLL